MTVSSVLKAVGAKIGGKAGPVTFKINSNGTYSAVILDNNGVPRTDSSYTIDNIYRGNLNQDTYEDAIVTALTCGASCGTDLTFVIYNPNGPVAVNVRIPDSLNSKLAGAAQIGIKNIVINNGRVTITAQDPSLNGLATYNYAFFVDNTGPELVQQ